MLEVKRKKGETFESFLRRFNRRLMQSGTILQAKKIRFFKRTKSKNVNRSSALHRKNMREKMEYLKKIGRLPEEEKFAGKKF